MDNIIRSYLHSAVQCSAMQCNAVVCSYDATMHLLASRCNTLTEWSYHERCPSVMQQCMQQQCMYNAQCYHNIIQ